MMPLIWNLTGSKSLEVSQEQFDIIKVMKVLWPEDHMVKVGGKNLRLNKILLEKPLPPQQLTLAD